MLVSSLSLVSSVVRLDEIPTSDEQLLAASLTDQSVLSPVSVILLWTHLHNCTGGGKNGKSIGEKDEKQAQKLLGGSMETNPTDLDNTPDMEIYDCVQSSCHSVTSKTTALITVTSENAFWQFPHKVSGCEVPSTNRQGEHPDRGIVG